MMYDVKKHKNPFFTYSLDGDCYRDSSDRLLGEFLKEDHNSMTPEVCKAICFEENNFQYAGVQHHYQCFCGNDAPPASKLLPQSQCSLSCSGDSSKKCGGAWTMNVYKKGNILKVLFKMHIKPSNHACIHSFVWFKLE